MAAAQPPVSIPPASVPPTQKNQEKEESTAYLRSLINKNLRVTTTDNRMFWGAFKCTDSESNIVLQHTYEYRPPAVTPQQLSDAAAAKTAAASVTEKNGAFSSSTPSAPVPAKGDEKKKTVKLDMTSRYLGLVVVPGKYIVRIEVEEFASQMRGREVKVLGVGEQGIAGGGREAGVVGVGGG